MVDWKTYKSQTPFQFVVAPSESYNEGNKIAFSPKIPGKSPVWGMDRSGIPITPTHTPCRYWTGEGWEWKTWSERICMGLEISYTKTTMDLNEQQVLQVKDSNGDIVDVDIVVWFLTGVGSIDAEIGSSITYTAPSISITESDTATIEMWCNGEVKDVLVITIPYKCVEGNTSIGYTSAQMSVNQQQTLQLLGCSDDFDDQCVWSVDHGSLSSGSGVEVVYTAPATNAGCVNNATITVTCNGAVVDTLKLAINGGVGIAIINDVNFRLVDYSDEEYCAWQYFKTRNEYSCDGTLYRTQDFAVAGASTTMYLINYYGRECLSWAESEMNTYCIEHWGQACADYDPDCNPYLPMCNMKDVRTAAQKAAGCCPAALM